MTGGGTGGHLAIIRAVKEQLANSSDGGRDGRHSRLDPESPVGSGEILNNRRKYPWVQVQDDDHDGVQGSLIYVGSTKGQDRQWFGEDEDFEEKYFFDTKGVVNQRGLGKLGSLWMMARATYQAIGIIRRHKAGVVFSVGGFSAAPMAFAAKLTRTPLVIHEQNAALGSLNKLLKPFADVFISSYMDESPIHAYPVKQVFFDKARIREQVRTVIFLGGSQGAQAINKLALEIAPQLHDRGIRIIHQAGERNIDETKTAYDELGIKAEVFGFTDRLAAYMEQADFAIARAGASTLWELSANALPTLFIPYPYAASDHQYHNAQFLAEKDLAWLMREDEIGPDKVLELLDEDMGSRSRGLMEIVEKDGAEQIAKKLVELGIGS
jgi:UDP-N-acetylglucosamine--N-acetylmuramyl-(pentapeptide) pyrophosphoryl-undecaprenol N-acetylglucosamine transferase